MRGTVRYIVQVASAKAEFWRARVSNGRRDAEKTQVDVVERGSEGNRRSCDIPHVSAPGVSDY